VGATLIEAELPQPIPTALQIVGTIIAYETMSRVSEFLQEQGPGLSFDQMLAEAGETTRTRMRAVAVSPGRPSRESYEAMLLQREQLKAALRMYFEEHGLSALAFPAARIPPAKIGEDTEVDISGQKAPMAAAAARNSAPGSCASMASLVLPAALTVDGLPVGMEFASLSGKDREVLALGLSLEKVLGPIPAPKV
jgi:indoleacetamide hydrolase